MSDRFWNKVNKDGPLHPYKPELGACWVWTGASGKQGYGSAWRGGKCLRAHRAAYEELVGPIPEGLDLLHSCDNPPCCNPAHLRPGTVSDNLRDMYDRGRANRPRGAAHGLSKLTEEQVLEMRARYAAGGVRQQDLAEAFGVTQALVGRIVRRLIWTHI